MTIVEKCRLMMSSFADVKAAIIEKGGPVPDGKGYNRYANAVRQLYSDTYTDEYQYPEKSHIIISYVAELVVWCKAIKEQIRLAIVDGGVDVPENIPFSEYGNKIREIQVLEIVTTRLPDAEYGIEYNTQIEAVGGVPPYTFYQSGFNPIGLKFNADGSVTGTPTSCGYYSYIKVTLTDSIGKSVEKVLNQSVIPQTVTVRLISASTFIYDGQPHKLDFECVEHPEIPITVKLGTDRVSEATEASTYYADISISGPYSINRDHDYYLTIEPLKVNISHSTPQTYAYDGEQHAYEYVASPEYAPVIKYKPYSSSDNLTSPGQDSGYTDTPPSEVGKYRVWFSTSDNNHTISDGSNQSPWYVFGVIEIKEADNV